MREYETVCVLRPESSDKEVKDVENRIGQLAKEFKGKILLTRPMGRKALAYPFGKVKEGIYLHLDYVGEGAMVSEVEKSLRFNEKVFRFMTVLLNKNVDVAKRAKELEATVEDA